MSGDDTGLLVVPGSVTSQLKDLSCQVLHDCRHVDGCACSHPLSVVAFPEEFYIVQDKTFSLPEEPVNPPHWELKSSPARAGLSLALGLSSLATARHFQLLKLKDLKECLATDMVRIHVQ